MNCTELTRPRKNAELVSSSTSHDWLAFCIQVPINDTHCRASAISSCQGRLKDDSRTA